LTPEQQARQEIDRQLAAAGWIVQAHNAMNLGVGPGVAVREFSLETGPVDYLLYVGGKVIGVDEAKPESHALKGVEIQSRKYVLGVPAHLPAWRRPPPFAYESTGAVTQFTNGLEPACASTGEIVVRPDRDGRKSREIPCEGIAARVSLGFSRKLLRRVVCIR